MSRYLGNFVLEKALGEGSLTRAYAAVDTLRETRVALKVFLPRIQTLLQQPRIYTQYRRDICTVAQLAHPCLVPTLGISQHNDIFFYVQPLMPGGSLFKSYARLSSSRQYKQATLERVASALQHVHRHNRFHGHLSPGNVLLDRNGTAYVADVGLWWLATLASTWSQASGPYVAPEVLRGDLRAVDATSDVYSLGCILREWTVAGLEPSQDYGRLSASTRSTSAKAAGLPRRWQPVISQLTATHQAERFESISGAQQAIDSAFAVPILIPSGVRRKAAQRLIKLRVAVKRPIDVLLRGTKRREMLIVTVTLLILLFVGFGRNWMPYVGAQLADPLRSAMGTRAVAQIQAIYLSFNDSLVQFSNRIGVTEPIAPWVQPEATRVTVVEDIAIVNPTPTTAATTPAAQSSVESQTFMRTPLPATETPSRKPTDLSPLGTLLGEGAWQDYLSTRRGIAAWRTYLQPDPERPSSIVAVVAFDLETIGLHYVLGAADPSLPGGPTGNGTIPTLDMYSGDLLATFNGGFKATHGGYGAMSDDTIAIPPTDGLATVGIFEDGAVQIGSWGEDFDASSPLRAWRQNAHLIIDDGTINPLVYSESVDDWGGTFTYDVVTWRSGMGISEEFGLLYFFAGPGLSMTALANSMVATGVEQAMLLDINEYWVHFASIHYEDAEPKATPLFKDGMELHADRYLRRSDRDFFYITQQE